MPDAARLEPGGLLGRGGAGEVRVAHDPVLGRDVALKLVEPGDPEARARLAREARLTARLEHPNIVPVHTAGVLPDGNPFYVMRLLSGRSLADAIHALPAAADRLALVRHVLEAAGGVAHAHARGVLHRDLKPANVMVGALGETVVADWGLACTKEEAADAGPGGTPGYMSPEQQRGEPLDERADVYGLGAILWEVLTGAPPPATPPPALAAAPQAPVELAAIVDRALAADRAARYPTAAALAEDLLRWFEGRRVSAYTYGPMELLERFVRAWRLPLAVALVGLLAVSGAVGVGWWRARAERDRAVDAEARVTAAHAQALQNLATAWLGQARDAARRGLRLEAETFAARSLTVTPSPEARGVLAQFGGRARPRRLATHPLGDCPRRAVSRDGARVVCAGASGLVVHEVGSGRSATLDVDARRVAVGPAGALFVRADGTLWAWSPPAAPVLVPHGSGRIKELGADAGSGYLPFVSSGDAGLVELATGRVVTRVHCAGISMPRGLEASSGGGFWGTCSDGAVFVVQGGEMRVLTRLDAADGVPVAVAARPEGLAVGTVTGQVFVLDAATGAVRQRFHAGSQEVTDVALHGDRLAAALSDGAVLVWSLRAGTEIARLRAPDGSLAWTAAGDQLLLVTTAAEAWSVPDVDHPHLLAVPAGVSAVDVSPDGALLAAGLGDGSVRVHAFPTGAAITTLRWQDDVVKDLAFRPDGERLAAVAVGGRAQPVYDTATWAPVRWIPGTGRRVTWLGDRGLVGQYDPFVKAFRDTGPIEVLAEVQLVELESDGAHMVALEDRNGLWRGAAGSPPALRRFRSFPGARAVAPYGEAMLLVVEDAILELDAEGQERRRIPYTVPSSDLAVSPDRALLAVANLDGTVVLLRADDGTTVARLEGHASRVASVTFSRDGRWLVTGGWDATVRTWSLDALNVPATELLAELGVEGAPEP